MKKFNYLILSFLFQSLLLQAQFDSEKYDKESFLIGTLNEYMGRQKTFTNGDNFYYQRIDIMSKNELKNALFTDSLFSTEYPDITIVNNGAPQGIKLYSPSFSKIIDDYYNFEPTGTRTMPGDTVYSGNLKQGKFVTEKQKLSFLLGAYLRFHVEKNIIKIIIQRFDKDNLLKEERDGRSEFYCISMPNASSKVKICEAFLNDFACENIKYLHTETIPNGNFVFFKPSPIIQEIINDAERLNKYIETNNTDFVEFTPNGTKFIWDEPVAPSFKK